MACITDEELVDWFDDSFLPWIEGEIDAARRNMRCSINGYWETRLELLMELQEKIDIEVFNIRHEEDEENEEEDE